MVRQVAGCIDDGASAVRTMAERTAAVAHVMERTWAQLVPHLPDRGALAALPPVRREVVSASRFAVNCHHWDIGATATLLMFHGGGANGRLMAPFAGLAVDGGMNAVAIDLPGYGATQVLAKSDIRYEDWCAVAAQMVSYLSSRTRLFVMGVSMGGLLAYEAVARAGGVHGVIATSLLDPADALTRRSLMRWAWMAPLAPAALALLPSLSDGLPVPMRFAANMGAISNHPAIATLIVHDAQSGGTWMPAGFLRTYLEHQPSVRPEEFDVCPVTLAHPMDDRWTDVALSRRFFDRLGVERQVVMLENCGHLPVESPGYRQLGMAIAALRDA